MEIISAFTRPVSSGNHMSGIYIRLNDHVFPDINWTDFSVIIIGWWLKELLNQLNGKKKGEYFFMDGSYFFVARFEEQRLVSLDFIDDKLTAPEIRFSYTIQKDEFVNSIKDCATSILSNCKKFQYNNSDVKELEMNLNNLNSFAV